MNSSSWSLFEDAEKVKGEMVRNNVTTSTNNLPSLNEEGRGGGVMMMI